MSRRPRSRRPARAGLMAVLAVLMIGGGVAFAAFTDSETNPQNITAAATFPGTGGKVKAQSMNPAPNETNQITLGLQLENTDAEPLNLATVTMRYWFTNDYGSGNLDSRCNFVPPPLDCSKVNRSVGVVDPARVGGDRYLQLAFASGTLAGGGKTGAIQVQVFRSSGSGPFNQSDDYSHTTRGSLGDAPNVTVYVSGKLVWGTEPTQRPATSGFRVRYTDLDGNPTNNSMGPGLIVENTGSVPLQLDDVTMRYWFSSDNISGAFQTHCDYAALGCGNITHRVENVTNPGADRAIVVGFTSGTLPPGSSTGEIRLRANSASFSNLDESNDYSHGSTGPFVEWPKVTGYVNGSLVWGTPP